MLRRWREVPLLTVGEPVELSRADLVPLRGRHERNVISKYVVGSRGTIVAATHSFLSTISSQRALGKSVE